MSSGIRVVRIMGWDAAEGGAGMTRIKAFVVAMFFVFPISGAGLVRQESLPPQPGSSGLSLVTDIWTFYCPAGGSATVAVDTLAVNNASTSPLDPVIRVYHEEFLSPVAWADDEVACSVSSDCGFACPYLAFNCVDGGEFTIMVGSWAGPLAGCGDAEGYYLLYLEVFAEADQAGASLPAETVGLGGQEPSRGYAWGYPTPGPAADDVAFWWGSTPAGADTSNAAPPAVPLLDKDPATH